MIDVQCPVCGEYVSDELDTCPFCQAQLRPLVNISSGDDKLPEAGDEPVNDNVDDVKQVTSEETDSDAPGANQSASSSEKEVTDWLSGLEKTANEEDKAPAWLANITDISKKDKQTEPSEAHEEIDWLNNLRDESDGKELDPVDENQEFTQEEPISQEGIPEWMKKLQEDVDSRSATVKPVQEIRQEEEKTETPDWLLRLQAETQAYAAAQEKSLSAKEEEAPDLHEKVNAGEPGAATANLPVEADAPDWAKTLQAETGKFAEEDDSSEEGIPDSIRKIQAKEPVSVEAASQVEDETTDWGKDMEVEPRAEKTESTPAETESSDWLKDMRADTPIFNEENAVPGEEIPDWLMDMGSEHPVLTNGASLSETTKPGAPEEFPSNGGEPDWLINLKAEGEASQQEAGGQVQTPLVAHQDDLELVPGWLQDIDKEEPLSIETPALILDDQASAMDVPGVPPPGDLPDWLAAMKADVEAPKAEEVPGGGSTIPAILPAELPSWVQDMQPAEAIMADAEVPGNELAQIAENEGPLAGLTGVLPASPGFGNPQKPFNFSIKLKVSEEQKQRASQLEKMLGEETRPKSIPPAGNNLQQRILRWVVSLLVVLSVAVPVFSGVHFTSGLLSCPPEVLAVSQVIFGLPPASPVLLVFDYEPAYSGELEATAAPLVSNLLLTGARITILSTYPTGSALAEYFLKNTQGRDAVTNDQQFTNLGFLAGGASGVLSFATNPSQTMPYAQDGSQPWLNSLLQDVHTLSDFAAVIILTDNSDTARIWVEQAVPLLNGKPMLMAISAQAEPMIRPYYDSKQIQGLVTGLSGGKAYEQLLQLPGLGQQYWDAFSSGIFLAELAIIFASLWSLISIFRNRKPAQKVEE